MCERICGFCKNFPGDGRQCYETLDIVSYSVRAHDCIKFEERVEEVEADRPAIKTGEYSDSGTVGDYQPQGRAGIVGGVEP